MKIIMLGCGTSSGVPLIGCDCAVCTSGDPRNRRRRVALVVEDEQARVLIDTPPDLHGQLVDAQIAHIDAVLFTHAHADHVHGIDDLRSINHHLGRSLDVYGTDATLDAIRTRFGYAFEPPPANGWWARPSLRPVPVNGPFSCYGIPVVPFPQRHGRSETTGYRLGAMAYSTDVNDLSDEAFDIIAGVRLWVVDCLGYRKHPTHAHLDLTLQWIERVKPQLAVLTHMSHQFDYETLRAALPAGVVPGYDGLVVDMDALREPA